MLKIEHVVELLLAAGDTGGPVCKHCIAPFATLETEPEALVFTHVVKLGKEFPRENLKVSLQQNS